MELFKRNPPLGHLQVSDLTEVSVLSYDIVIFMHLTTYKHF